MTFLRPQGDDAAVGLFGGGAKPKDIGPRIEWNAKDETAFQIMGAFTGETWFVGIYHIPDETMDVSEARRIMDEQGPYVCASTFTEAEARAHFEVFCKLAKHLHLNPPDDGPLTASNAAEMLRALSAVR